VSVERLRSRYRDFVKYEAPSRSELYGELAQGIADDDELLRWLDGLPFGKRQPNLVFASARIAGGTPSGFPEFRQLLSERRDEVEALIMARRTQTNEPARCATLLPLLGSLPQPLALLEVGASAGLCLLPDRYAYDYGDLRLGEGPPVLRCRLTGPAPEPAVPQVAWRAGLDLSPVDVADPEAVRWLEALIWPGPTEATRLANLHGALEVARADPPRVIRGDLTKDLPALAAEAPRDATLVVFHTAVLAYVPTEGRDAFRRDVEALDAVWIANEAPRILGVDPATVPRDLFVLARDGVPLAHTDGHGATVDWLAAGA
jgi:hypothetical protein